MYLLQIPTSSAEPTCIWYGVCSNKGEKVHYCSYNETAPAIETGAMVSVEYKFYCLFAFSAAIVNLTKFKVNISNVCFTVNIIDLRKICNGEVMVANG